MAAGRSVCIYFYFFQITSHLTTNQPTSLPRYTTTTIATTTTITTTSTTASFSTIFFLFNIVSLLIIIHVRITVSYTTHQHQPTFPPQHTTITEENWKLSTVLRLRSRDIITLFVAISSTHREESQRFHSSFSYRFGIRGRYRSQPY